MKEKKQLPELKPAEFVIFSPDCFTTNNSSSLYTVPFYFQRDGFVWLSIHLGYKFNLKLDGAKYGKLILYRFDISLCKAKASITKLYNCGLPDLPLNAAF